MPLKQSLSGMGNLHKNQTKILTDPTRPLPCLNESVSIIMGEIEKR